MLPTVKPVGYYAWVDDRTVAPFVLGDRGQPATLQIADTQTGKAELVATGIDRSIQRMPSGQISFVHLERGAEGAWTAVASLDRFELRNVSRLAVSPKGDRLAMVGQAK